MFAQVDQSTPRRVSDFFSADLMEASRCLHNEPALLASKPDQFFVAYDRFITAAPPHLGVFGRTVAF